MAALICASVNHEGNDVLAHCKLLCIPCVKKPGDCRAVHAPPRSVLAVIRVVADRLSAVERVGVWQMGRVRSGNV